MTPKARRPPRVFFSSSGTGGGTNTDIGDKNIVNNTLLMAANMKGGGRKISLQSYFEPKIAPLAAAS